MVQYCFVEKCKTTRYKSKEGEENSSHNVPLFGWVFKICYIPFIYYVSMHSFFMKQVSNRHRASKKMGESFIRVKQSRKCTSIPQNLQNMCKTLYIWLSRTLRAFLQIEIQFNSYNIPTISKWKVFKRSLMVFSFQCIELNLISRSMTNILDKQNIGDDDAISSDNIDHTFKNPKSSNKLSIPA